MLLSTELILLYNSVLETLLMIYIGLDRRIMKSGSLKKVWNVNCCQFSAEISLRHLEVIKEVTSLWRRQDCTGWDWPGPYLILADFADFWQSHWQQFGKGMGEFGHLDGAGTTASALLSLQKVNERMFLSPSALAEQFFSSCSWEESSLLWLWLLACNCVFRENHKYKPLQVRRKMVLPYC